MTYEGSEAGYCMKLRDIQREVDKLYPFGARVFLAKDEYTGDPVIEIVCWDRSVNCLLRDNHLTRPMALFKENVLIPAIAWLSRT